VVKKVCGIYGLLSGIHIGLVPYLLGEMGVSDKFFPALCVLMIMGFIMHLVFLIRTFNQKQMIWKDTVMPEKIAVWCMLFFGLCGICIGGYLVGLVVYYSILHEMLHLFPLIGGVLILAAGAAEIGYIYLCFRGEKKKIVPDRDILDSDG
jgi:hypothetical protein